jgi:hypothetical protein
MKRVNQQQQIKFLVIIDKIYLGLQYIVFGGSRSGRGIRAENTNKIITKKKMKRKI